MDKLILHCDLNNFYASVECVLNHAYRDVPLAVSGNPEKRHGVILAKNELAKKKGIRTGDVIWEAKQKEPNLVLVQPHFDLYMKYSKQVFDIYTRYTCYVEPFGADECWLDCTGSTKLFGDGPTIADTLRRVVKEETGLTLSVGVSFNKIFAKLGSDLKKPDATTVIARDNYKQKIWNLPADEMMMVGRKTYEKLKKLNIFTIGDLALADPQLLKTHFGINGIKLWESARGENAEPVREAVLHRAVESVGHGMTAVRDIVNYEEAGVLIYYLADLVAARMRKYKFRGSGVSIDLRNNELEHMTRQTKLALPTFTGADIAQTAIALMKNAWKLDKPMRTITVSVFDLVPLDSYTQMTMFDEELSGKKEKLERAIDNIREKYGHDKILRASLIKQDFIYDKTDAEDFLPFQR